jgi:hypothetical protein
MNIRKQKQSDIVVRHVDQPTQNANLQALRARLERIRTQPCMGELAPALLTLLDAGRIVCKYDDRRGRSEIVFAADVTPADIRKLLPLVTHPVPYSILRFFLEGMVYIANESTKADALMFRNTEEFLALPHDTPSDEILRSGVEHPEEMAAAMMCSLSEMAVAKAIGFPVAPAADGWIHPPHRRQDHRGHTTSDNRCTNEPPQHK